MDCRLLPAAAAVALTAVTPAASLDAASVVRLAVAAFEAQRHGVAGCIERYRFHEHGPAHDKTQDAESAFVRTDGSLVFVRAISGDARDEQTEPYVLPLSLKTLDDYRFSYGAGGTIAFTSLRRDDEHGDGTMTIDSASGRIERIDFQPSALPAHTDSGAVTIQFGEALPGWWEIVGMHERYTGHMLFLHGGAEIDRQYVEFRRFASLEEAKAWAQSERP